MTASRVRLSIIGVIVIAMFSALFARLYYLQVAASRSFRTAAISNQIREVQRESTRGLILDRNGKVLVDNEVVTAVTIDRRTKKADLDRSVANLTQVLDVPEDKIRSRINDRRISPYTPVPVATNVSIEKVTYIEEHAEDFPGVAVAPLTIRRYPNGTLAAHLLGYTGEISDTELKNRPGYQLGDTIGKSGIESSYESDLRGKPAVERLAIDSKGNVVRVVSRDEGAPGNNVQLSIDLDIQKAADKALEDGILQARKFRDTADKTKYATFKAPAGAAVVLDATDGSIVAVSSYPTFNPGDFVNGIPTATWQFLNDPQSAYPLNNRAVQGLYAPGSTFKPISAVGFMSAGITNPNAVVNDKGSVKVADITFSNDNGEVNGLVDLSRSLTVSSDVYYYTYGAQLWQMSNQGDQNGYALQNVARQFGFGARSGIDFGDEAKGRVPDPKWKESVHKENPTLFPYPNWLPGDNVQLAIGQGDLLVTPLQLALSYATIANGGQFYAPHAGAKIVDQNGNVVRTVPVQAGAQVTIPPDQQQAILRGLDGVVRDPKGTAYEAFNGFPFDVLPVAGKTGTAQVQGKQNTSLFVGMTRTDRPLVVAVLVEQAGYGASVAAPIARRIFEQMAGVQSTAPVMGQAAGKD